jgi:hypothetical protein
MTIPTEQYSCDVIVHEAAHLLHYLKPELFGLPVPKGKERFVDVDFHYRELFAYACEAYSRVMHCDKRASRIEFAEKMRDEAYSFPSDQLGPVSDLVVVAARARNGWRTIRDATVIKRVSDLLDMMNGPTDEPNNCQKTLATIALLDVEVPNGGLLQFFWNCPGWVDEVSPALRNLGLSTLADVYERSIADLVAEFGTYSEFRKRGTLEA